MKKLFRFVLSIILVSGTVLTASAQKDLTLEECINIALDNNLDIQMSQNNALIAKSNKFQAMMNYLPNLSAGVNYDLTAGTFFDQFAGRQVSTTTNTSDPFIRSSFNVFNGFANHHNLRQRTNELEAATQGIEASKLDVKNNVFTAYLNVILDKENIRISDDRVELLEAQLDREIKRESVGVGNMESVYNFRSQVANEKLNNVRLKNTLQSDMLRLVQLLRLNVNDDYRLITEEYADADLLVEAEPYGDVLAKSMAFSPSLKQANASYKASKYAMKGARAQRYPSVSLFGQIGSRYSSNGARNPTTGEVEENASLTDQLDWNSYEYANLSMNIPIFTRYQTSTNIQVAKLNMHNAELSLQQTEQNVTNTIQTVYLDLISAQATYKAALENLESLEQSFDFINKRYETGNTDFFTYLESLNNKNRAEIELVNAKYSIIFRKKIIGLFEGEG